MKKIIIVQDALYLGGIEKSLINFLRKHSNDYDITLLLFNPDSPMVEQVPKNVKIMTIGKLFSIMGYSRGYLKKNYKFGYFVKCILYGFARLFGRRASTRLLWLFCRKIKGFDFALSYAHPLPSTRFNGGAAEFVLSKVKAKDKVCFIHCDWKNAGVQSKRNDKLLKDFDWVACVSNSVRQRLLSMIPELKDKAIVVYNETDEENVRALAKEGTFEYDNNFINIITVARIVEGKGIDRAINALYETGRKDIRYYLIGKGNARERYEQLSREKGLDEQVFFMGEKENPYAYMQEADYLLLPSAHEAAPMVFGEARALNLKIITTDTLSAREMVTARDGIVCENSAKGIENILRGVKKEK